MKKWTFTILALAIVSAALTGCKAEAEIDPDEASGLSLPQ